MLKIENAPQKGMIYAMFVDKIKYGKYASLADIEDYLTTDKLLELHLFDSQKEIRVIKTAGKGLQTFEISADDESQYDDMFVERLFTTNEGTDIKENLSDCVEVINYIKYDENDMIRIVNYRLKEAK